ncbi:hypothetical protein QQO69_05610 [Clostridioides difficile]|uniref:hypothetical protein n=1 Tax=Clostridioides difficile TaxID=1496 RepID=UPI000AAE4690|nr:hypothetical protein [Clostridioides difficile]MCM4098861.1 hypothetical protein [Clostridioides difficile]MDL0334902.1 hypothetical protein [Clostridioides difficile]
MNNTYKGVYIYEYQISFYKKKRGKFHVYVEEETGKKKQKSYGNYEKKKYAEKHLI